MFSSSWRSTSHLTWHTSHLSYVMSTSHSHMSTCHMSTWHMSTSHMTYFSYVYFSSAIDMSTSHMSTFHIPYFMFHGSSTLLCNLFVIARQLYLRDVGHAPGLFIVMHPSWLLPPAMLIIYMNRYPHRIMNTIGVRTGKSCQRYPSDGRRKVSNTILTSDTLTDSLSHSCYLNLYVLRWPRALIQLSIGPSLIRNSNSKNGLNVRLATAGRDGILRLWNLRWFGNPN